MFAWRFAVGNHAIYQTDWTRHGTATKSIFLMNKVRGHAGL